MGFKEKIEERKATKAKEKEIYQKIYQKAYVKQREAAIIKRAKEDALAAAQSKSGSSFLAKAAAYGQRIAEKERKKKKSGFKF